MFNQSSSSEDNKTAKDSRDLDTSKTQNDDVTLSFNKESALANPPSSSKRKKPIREKQLSNMSTESTGSTGNQLLDDLNNSKKEYAFVIGAGICLSFNSGYVNGSALSGLLTPSGVIESVSGFTGTYTTSALALADGNMDEFSFHVFMIMSFIFGAFLSSLMTPKTPPYQLAPNYGPTFLVGGVFLTIASILASIQEDDRHFFYFAGAANGIQNGISSMYSANLIRSCHLTGTSTDIGLILGQIVRGHRENFWKLIILCSLASSFWFGGFVSYYSTHRFTHHTLFFNAGFFLFIGVSLVMFIVKEYHISIQEQFDLSSHHKRVNDLSDRSGRSMSSDNGSVLKRMSSDSGLLLRRRKSARRNRMEDMDGDNSKLPDHVLLEQCTQMKRDLEDRALRLLDKIREKERKLSVVPSVKGVSELVSLYRKATRMFQVAGNDHRGKETSKQMDEFLANPITVSILDGSFHVPKDLVTQMSSHSDEIDANDDGFEDNDILAESESTPATKIIASRVAELSMDNVFLGPESATEESSSPKGDASGSLALYEAGDGTDIDNVTLLKGTFDGNASANIDSNVDSNQSCDVPGVHKMIVNANEDFSNVVDEEVV
mmetsp:Transcript_23672/g.36554  ORF Transcript_23672/g.36554 Transcript_23672/m.36554 type:complete len:604 (+) Transcript_23672:110-1921(+)|eukprot:CAMPEP_0195308714 /NCGR_PEP_ID=MMETSP0707-20130614/38367_1 /TAXON_ID=33640 /ORGANISM="Asterionellopsis glacialis, Strain CCMP134" /LENGTH=603 /DNA_ID=CAMNT_0040372997 /DNA_START=54 /DNA_END=1865 /DNA_ORIENTATION=-